MDNVYELVNVEIHEYCALNVESGEKKLLKEKKQSLCHRFVFQK